MKKLFILLLTAVLVLSLSACGDWDRIYRDGENDLQQNALAQSTSPDITGGTLLSGESAGTISRERAIELALNDAGVTIEEARDLEAELDRERDGVFWEVDFECGGYEYSYDIDSATGEVTKAEREFD